MSAAAAATLSEHSGARIGMRTRASAAEATSGGTPAEFLSDHHYVAFLKGKIPKLAIAFCGEEDQSAAGFAPPRLEACERAEAANHQGLEIVHPGAPKTTVGEWKTGGLDNCRLGAEAGAGAQHGAGVGRDIGLKERERQRKRGHPLFFRQNPAPGQVAGAAAANFAKAPPFLTITKS